MLNLVAAEVLFYAAALAFSGSVMALMMTRFPARAQVDIKGPIPETRRARVVDLSTDAPVAGGVPTELCPVFGDGLGAGQFGRICR